jgi:hypothetical protein
MPSFPEVTGMPRTFPPPPPIEVLPDRPKKQNWQVKKRDEQIRRFVRAIRRQAPALDDVKFTPTLRGYAMVTLTMERLYGRLKSMSDEQLVRDDGNAVQAIDSLRNLARTQASLARELCLTPSAAVSLSKPVAVLDLQDYRNDEKPE